MSETRVQRPGLRRVRRARRSSLVWAALIAGTAAVLVALLVIPLAEAPSATGGGTLAGSRAPDLNADDLDGRRWRLGDAITRANTEHGADLIWINFWAAWCAPCRTEMPAMQALAERHGDRLLIVGVNAGEERASVVEFVDRYEIGYAILLDSSLENLYRWSPQFGLPRHYFVDAEGVVVREVVGELPPAEMVALLEELLPARR